jgi:uncharacterized membrane protein
VKLARFGVYPFLLLLTNAVFFALHWSGLPERLPRQFSFQGVPTTFWPKTVALSCNLAFMVIFTAIMLVSLRKILKQPPPYHPTKIALGVITGLFYAIMGLLSSINLWTIWRTAHGTGAWTMPFVPHLGAALLSALIAMALVTAGPEMAVGPVMSPEDRKDWKAWLFYYNPANPRVWVPKRYGLGWTLNFARPISYLFLILIIAVPVIIIAIAQR